MPVSNNLAIEADAAKIRLEDEYTQKRTKQMIAKGGRNP